MDLAREQIGKSLGSAVVQHDAYFPVLTHEEDLPMKHLTVRIVTLLALAWGLAGTANATLIDEGNGLIYDSAQNLTWLQDANLAATTTFGVSGITSDGAMTWDTAEAWIAAMNAADYKGYNDWRLPTITDTGTPGCNFSDNGTDCGYNVDTSGSELAYMWYDILGNTAFDDTSGNPTGCNGNPPYCLTSTSADGVSIDNLQPDYYWSSTEYAPSNASAWYFGTWDGVQDAFPRDVEIDAWAVRSGNVTGVPAPATRWLFAVGLLGLGVVTRRRCWPFGDSRIALK